MNKLLAKLIASILALTVAASLVAMSSYAWFTISNTPEVDGVQINIAGSDTIMLAADLVTVGEDGVAYHYPGTFSRELDFSSFETYDYLKTLAPLTPVSTADGVHWIRPDYFDAEDPAVQQGMAVVGQMKDLADFSVDTTLEYGNLLPEEISGAMTGSYIYLDFWVVSPAAGYELRVSTGSAEEETGSFVISRMEPQEDGSGGYILSAPDETAAASVRVGFLVNQDWATFTNVQHYLGSDGYSSLYTHLMGRYQEPGEPLTNFSAATNHFTIYEPNGDLHPAQAGENYYSITNPLGLVNGAIKGIDVSDRLTVQLTNAWKQADTGEGTLLEQEFITAMFGQDLSEKSTQYVTSLFYEQRLQGLLTPYLTRGSFVEKTQALYRAAENGRVEAEHAALHSLAGATEDVTIAVLQKNVPQRIRMFIWLEGQDEDCVNHETASNLIINLEFAGSNDR